jgi:DinB superfamily
MTVTLPADTDTVTTDDLRRFTNAMIDRAQGLLRRCQDVDVTFLPQDPLADDPGAEPGHEQNAAWTLGHIIVHMTASAEESAALAAELARGVAYHGRSRREVPWQSVTTLAHCRARLEESRHLCMASLGMWPNRPDLANTYVPWEGAAPMGAIARYLLGLRHEAAHLEQLRDVTDQARADRRRKTLWGRWRSRSRRRPDSEADRQQNRQAPQRSSHLRRLAH